METSPLSSIGLIYGRTIGGGVDSTVIGFKYSLSRHNTLSKSREVGG